MAETNRPDVATATRWQIPAVAAALGEAFAADPVFAWLFPDPMRRPGQLEAWWERMIRSRPMRSEIWQAADAACGAIWHAPQYGEPAPDETFAPWFIEVFGDDAIVDERFELLGAAVEAHPNQPHWYLVGVGTRPEHQGRGLGNAILEPILERCDADGFDSYLESSNPRNVAFYERLGFGVVGRIPVPDESTELTLMLRRPR